MLKTEDIKMDLTMITGATHTKVTGMAEQNLHGGKAGR